MRRRQSGYGKKSGGENAKSVISLVLSVFVRLRALPACPLLALQALPPASF